MPFARLSLILTLLILLLNTAGYSDVADAVYWRFEGGQAGSPITTAADESGKVIAAVGGKAPTFSQDIFAAKDIDPDNPMQILPVVASSNHNSAAFDGGYLIVKPFSQLDLTKSFTIELWAKFGPKPSVAQVFLSDGPPASGTLHLIYAVDGSVQCAVCNVSVAQFFGPGSGVVPGVWYHLAAVFEDCGEGRKRLHLYINGNLQSSSAVSSRSFLQKELIIGAYGNGNYPFHSLIDELKISAAALKPEELLIGGPKPFPGMAKTQGDTIQGIGYYGAQSFPELPKPPKPLFVKAGTRIDSGLLAKAAGAPILAKPNGYTYFYTCAGAQGQWSDPGEPFVCANVPAACDPAFGTAYRGWYVNKGGAPASYHFSVKPGGKYVVAVGFYDPATQPGKRLQYVVIDGKRVDQIDPAVDGKGKPLVKKYEAQDLNKDGYLEVTCCHVIEDVDDYTGMMNVIWIFPAANSVDLDVARLVRGKYDIPPIYYVNCGPDKGIEGHVGYPKLSSEAKARMLPERVVPFELKPGWPQPADPLEVNIDGELADRINTFLDRWGYAPRDQKLIAGFLSDCGYETSARYLLAIAQLSRLMHYDFDLKVSMDAFISKQDKTSKYPGSIVGGDPLRTAQFFSQGLSLTSFMAYHEISGDPCALEAARKLGDWYQYCLNNGDVGVVNYLSNENKFSRMGAAGHLGKGAPEGMMWLYWRTKDKKYLDITKQMAELNRKWGSVAWTIHGDSLPNEHPEYEDFHLHTAMTTLRGFPWLYAATGDRSYLNDAIKACDRVFERSTWSTGQVAEQTSWGHDAPLHDETCQTAELLQLSYLLAEFTGEGRFYDRAEHLYYDGIRYLQTHDGDFMGYDSLPGPVRGTSWWYCCSPWGGRALYEVARHLYASSPTAIYVNGFMPSSADLKLKLGTVSIETTANIPNSGDIHFKLTPKGAGKFDVKIRVPGWAMFRSVAINGRNKDVCPKDGYITLGRKWKADDKVDVRFDLPLRVVLNNSWDGRTTAKASLDGAEPVNSRCVSIFRGPVILAQFRLANGCDLNWAYTGDHPDLPDSLTSTSEVIEAADWNFQNDSSPVLTKVTKTPEGVKLECEMTPHPGWTLKKTALVRSSVPVEVEYTSELIAPDAVSARSLKSARMCGVRMRTIGFVDYKKAKLLVGDKRKQIDFPKLDGNPLDSRKAVLDNGYVQFHVESKGNSLVANEGETYAGIYALPVVKGNSLKASCKLKIIGQNQWHAPIISPQR